MISISPMTGTGLKKWRPMNLGARSVAVARPVMLMLLVFVAKIASRSAERVNACQVSRLTDSSSNTASMTMSWPAAPSVPSAVPMRPRTSSAASCWSLPFSTWRERLEPMRSLPFSASSAVRSERVTCLPAAALTWAIPWPIRPAPMTKTRSMLMYVPQAYQPRLPRSPPAEVGDRPGLTHGQADAAERRTVGSPINDMRSQHRAIGRTLGRVDQVPLEALEGDIVTAREAAQQLRMRSVAASRGSIEDLDRVEAEPPRCVMERSKVNHYVARIRVGRKTRGRHQPND